MTHREIIKDFLANLDLKQGISAIDWGSGSKPAIRYLKPNCKFSKYTTVDNAPGIPEDRKFNHIDKDICQPVTLPQADVAFCLEVLEHVEDPFDVLVNIYNNLKHMGVLYLSAPFKYDIHAEADYWRFTKYGLALLIEKVGFSVISIRPTIDDLGYIVQAVKP